jgi:hypothetical protein
MYTTEDLEMIEDQVREARVFGTRCERCLAECETVKVQMSAWGPASAPITRNYCAFCADEYYSH